MSLLDFSALKFLLPKLGTGPFLFILLLLAGLITVEWITAKARKALCFQVDPEAVRCVSRPAWLASSDHLTHEIIKEIQDKLAVMPEDSIFSEDLEERLNSDPSFLSPWIESLEIFERIYPSQYRIELKLRRPVAVFLHRGRSYSIDAAGVVIGCMSSLEAGSITADIPVITGFGNPGPIRNGLATGNLPLLEGSAVAREIEVFGEVPLASDLKIKEIDVSHFDTSSYPYGRPDNIILITEEDVRILWGRSSLNPRVRGIDPTPLKKAMSLEKVLEWRPRFKGLEEVNVTMADETPVKLAEGENGF